MRKTLLVMCCTVFFTPAFCQVDIGTWVAGGNGLIRFNKQYSPDGQVEIFKEREFDLNILLGKFIADKFLVGLKPFLYSYRAANPSESLTSKIDRIGIGPFVRYYVKPSGNQFNFFVESSFQYGLYSFVPTKGRVAVFSAYAGTVWFLNESVGVELLAGYKQTKQRIGPPGFTQKITGLDIAIGIQFYLQKD